MKKILAVCDHCCHSGFARVAHQIMEHLSKTYEVHVLGINYLGDPHNQPYRVYPAQLFKTADGRQASGDMTGIQSLPYRIEEIEPDAVFLFNDLQVIEQWVGVLEQAKIKIPLVTYFPVDSRPQPRRFRETLKKATLNVTYTEWGKEVIGDPDLRVIPHGVNTAVFRPRDKLAIREELRIPPESFVVFRCDRNQPRKNWFATLRIFRKFYERHPESKLICHTVFIDIGGNLYDFVDLLGFPRGAVVETGIKRNGKTLAWRNAMNGIPDEELAKTYACADVYLSTSKGEGWGLSASEAQSTGLPVIGTNYSSFEEILSKGRGIPLKVKAWQTGDFGSDFAIVDEVDGERALEKVFRDKDYAQAIAKQGMAYARKLDWKEIVPQWGKVFAEVLNG